MLEKRLGERHTRHLVKIANIARYTPCSLTGGAYLSSAASIVPIAFSQPRRPFIRRSYSCSRCSLCEVPYKAFPLPSRGFTSHFLFISTSQPLYDLFVFHLLRCNVCTCSNAVYRLTSFSYIQGGYCAFVSLTITDVTPMIKDANGLKAISVSTAIWRQRERLAMFKSYIASRKRVKLHIIVTTYLCYRIAWERGIIECKVETR